MGVLDDELCEGVGETKNADFGQQRECRNVVFRYGAENELCQE